MLPDERGDDWTLEELAACVRAEIERDGVPVHVSDQQLVWALLEPTLRAWERYFGALVALGEVAWRASEAVDRLADVMGRSAEMDTTLLAIHDLPGTTIYWCSVCDTATRGPVVAGDSDAIVCYGTGSHLVVERDAA